MWTCMLWVYLFYLFIYFFFCEQSWRISLVWEQRFIPCSLYRMGFLVPSYKKIRAAVLTFYGYDWLAVTTLHIAGTKLLVVALRCCPGQQLYWCSCNAMSHMDRCLWKHFCWASLDDWQWLLFLAFFTLKVFLTTTTINRNRSRSKQKTPKPPQNFLSLKFVISIPITILHKTC